MRNNVDLCPCRYTLIFSSSSNSTYPTLLVPDLLERHADCHCPVSLSVSPCTATVSAQSMLCSTQCRPRTLLAVLRGPPMPPACETLSLGSRDVRLRLPARCPRRAAAAVLPLRGGPSGAGGCPRTVLAWLIICAGSRLDDCS
jgi:hypothetical protein